MRVSIKYLHSKSPELGLQCFTARCRGREHAQGLELPMYRWTALVRPRGILGRLLPLPPPPRANDHRRVKQTSPLKSTRKVSLVGISSTAPRAVRCAVSLHVRRVGRDLYGFFATSTTDRTDAHARCEQKAPMPHQGSPRSSEPTARGPYLTHQRSGRDDERECGVSGRRPSRARQRSRSALRSRCCLPVLFCDNVWSMMGLA